MQQTTLGFDVYGTLIDTAGVTEALEAHAGSDAPEFAQLWREKQLEYSFRRALMQNYRDFSVCTRQALDYAARRLQVRLSDDDKEGLMAQYRKLPAFPGVAEGLAALADTGCRCFAFSNGRADDVEALLDRAGIRHHFLDVVSCDEMRSFKPNPATYAHFLRRAEVTGGQAWLVSSNPFDVIGAISAGMRAAWVQRNPSVVFDPWEIEPTTVIKGLEELPGIVT